MITRARYTAQLGTASTLTVEMYMALNTAQYYALNRPNPVRPGKIPDPRLRKISTRWRCRHVLKRYISVSAVSADKY